MIKLAMGAVNEGETIKKRITRLNLSKRLFGWLNRASLSSKYQSH